MRKRKRVLLAAASLAVIAGIAAFVFAPRGGYVSGQPDQTGYEDGWTYYYREGSDRCAAVSWEWDGDPDRMTITVPETLGGRTVTALSSSSWTIAPFHVILPESLRIQAGDGEEFEGFAGETAFEDTDYVTYHFTVVLDPNIEEVACRDSWSGVLLADGTEDVVYKLEYTFIQDGGSEDAGSQPAEK